MSRACDAKWPLSQAWWRVDRAKNCRRQRAVPASALATWRQINRATQGSGKKGCCAAPDDVDASADPRMMESHPVLHRALLNESNIRCAAPVDRRRRWISSSNRIFRPPDEAAAVLISADEGEFAEPALYGALPR
jgi:hypothetical protein